MAQTDSRPAPIFAVTPELSASWAAAYGRDGYLIVPGVFTQVEIAEAAAEAERLAQRFDLIHSDNIRCRWQNHVESGECLFDAFDPVIDLGPVCARLARDSRILDILARVYGEEACLFKDKLIFKPPGAQGYGLHQDYIAWSSFPRSFVTVLVPIDASNPENGCTEVFPGYHHRGCLTPEDGMYHEVPAELIDDKSGVKLVLQPGDIALFGAMTPHRSAPNLTDLSRRQLYLSYNALSDGGEQRGRHYDEFHAWLRDRYAEYNKTHVYFA